MNEQQIEKILQEFHERKSIPAKEFGKRFRREIPMIRHAFYAQGILLHRVMKDGNFFYELRKLNDEIIREIMRKGTFVAQYIASQYGLHLHDLREFCRENGFILENVNHRKYRIVSGETNNPVPCLQNIQYCSHVEQCYLSYKCKAVQNFINRKKGEKNG